MIANDPLHLVAATKLFSCETQLVDSPHGLTVAELIERCGIPSWVPTRVYVNGDLVYPDYYHVVRPKPGSHVLVRVVPRGGGGGGHGKSIGSIIAGVLLIAVGAIMIATGTVYSFGTLSITGYYPLMFGLGLVLSGIGGLLVPPPAAPKLRPLSGGSAKDAESPTLSITGQQNNARPYGVVPRVFGTHRIFPPYAALPFTEQVGANQYLRLLFCTGLGITTSTDHRIGDTPLDHFDEVEIEVNTGDPGDPPITLYTTEVFQEPLSIALTAAGGAQARTSARGAVELSVDVAFPNGLVQFTADTGAKTPVTVSIRVEYAPFGTGTYVEAPGSPIVTTEASQAMVRTGLRWVVASGQYDVRLTRLTADSTDPQQASLSFWTALRTFGAQPAVTMPPGIPLALTAMRIKATDQLNGVIDSYNCIASSVMLDWDAGTSTWVERETSNPASHYRRVLQGPENAAPLPDSRLDLPALQAWHEECDADDYMANLVVDYSTNIFDLLKTIAAAGRATPTFNDDRHATVRDLPQTVPRQHFTPRTTKRWRARRAMVDPIHALKTRFIDPASNWQQVERLVYADGFDETNASRFEVLELHGVTDPDQAWKLARYHLAVTQLRPEAHDFETDIEALVSRRGDLVQVAHDVLEHGLAWGRVKTVATAGPNATAITLDEDMPMDASGNYGVRLRLSDGTSVLAPVLTTPGAVKTLTFTSPVAPPLPAPGDLALFGLMGLESRAMLVSRIMPTVDFDATITVVDAAPAVLSAHLGPIPPWDPQMTLPPPTQQLPPMPVVVAIASDETVLLRDVDGSLRVRVLITLRYEVQTNARADYLEVRLRRVDSAAPFTTLPPLPPESSQVSITEVEERVTYDFRLRTVNRDGTASAWAEVLDYFVIGKTTPPPPPTDLRYGDGSLWWLYPAPPPDFSAFEVRRSPGATGNWETAVEMHAGLVFSPFLLPTIYGQWTFLVAAVDTSGIASAPVTLTVDFGDVRLHNQVATKDYDADGYPGTITNGSVSAGDLKADQVPTGFWANDANRFWSASGVTLFWAGTYKEMTYLFSYTTAGNAAGTTMFFDTTVVASAWSMFYRVGASGDYLPWTGALTNVLASQLYDFKLVTDASPIQGVVSRLTLYLDAEDVSEKQSNVAINSAGTTRLTLQQTYRAIKTVQPTVVAGAGETATSAIAADKQATAGAGNGPNIKTYNAAGLTAGHVDVDLVGY